MPEKALLVGSGLVKRYPVRGRSSSDRGVLALDDVSMALNAGEVVAVVGRSGSGKSTLARVLVGLETPDAGEVMIAGERLRTSDLARMRELRRTVQLVLQEPRPALDPLQTVGSAVAEPMAIHALRPPDEREDSVVELLSRVGLNPTRELRRKLPHELSGGECQRVLLARALACEPRTLILDEPVSALDAALRRQVLAELLTLRERQGLALLVIGHDLRLLRRIAGRVLVMDCGRVVEEGESERIMLQPSAAATTALLAAAGMSPPGVGREPWSPAVR